MVMMGNASGRSEGEGSSDTKDEAEDSMEFFVGQTQHGPNAFGEGDPMMVHSPPHSPRNFLQPPIMFSPQVPMVPFIRPAEATQPQTYPLPHISNDFRETLREKLTAVMIEWNYDAKRVEVTGSWDNWENRKLMQKSGKDFIIMKMLPSGVYHYRFIVDGQFRYAPEVPWEKDDSGTAYNILDVQEFVPEATESLSEFQSPPSPLSSYDNEILSDKDFATAPPELPPQIQLTLLNERGLALESEESLPRPQNSALNHVYIQNNSLGQTIALGATHRFLQKYVTVVLYQSSGR